LRFGRRVPRHQYPIASHFPVKSAKFHAVSPAPSTCVS
jgi:hypothetical protein